MNNPFKQPEEIWCLSLITKYKYLPSFETEFEDKSIAIASNEISSETIESMEDDIWKIEIYFDIKPSLEIIPENLFNLIQEHSIKIELLEHKDWTALVSLEDIKTDLFHIARSKDNIDNSKIPVIINITQAFGTGDHETTMGCIEALELEKEKKIQSVIDIGTGTGILAICAKKLWPYAKVVGTDIDKVAIEVSEKHAKLNNTEIDFYLADGTGDKLDEQKFDIILANILARPLIEMAENITALAKNTVILSGFLENQLPDILSKYVGLGLSESTLINNDKWITLVLKKNF